MAEYEHVKLGKLKLKGEKEKLKKRKHKSDKIKSEKRVKTFASAVDEDALKHAGWWRVTKFGQITGSVALQFGQRTYVKALDNGLFTVGAPHADGDGPSPEEIFTAFPINENKVAFKSGYGKYLKIEKDGIVTGRSEAVGCMEQWEPIFEDSRTAILSETGFFMSIDPEDDACVAIRKNVGELEVVVIRCCTQRESVTVDSDPQEEKGDLSQVEINYVKKFQKFQDKKLRINKNDVEELEKAKNEGIFHEKLLDRRSKMKADRYCK